MPQVFKTLLDALLSELKDAKTLALRIVALSFLAILYFLYTNQAAIVTGFQNLSAEKVMIEIRDQKRKQFPLKAQYEAEMLQVQLNADVVAVFEYQPEFLNNYIELVAQHGKVKLSMDKFKDIPVNKLSQQYKNFLDSWDYYDVDDEPATTTGKVSRLSLDTSYPENLFTETGLRYFYTMPYYSPKGILAGFVLVAWKDQPADFAEGTSARTQLVKLTLPVSRSLMAALPE